MKSKMRRIAVVGLPMLQSVHNLGSVAIANYAERMGNWRFVLGAEATVAAFQFLRTVECDGAIVRILSPAMKREALKVTVPLINVSAWLDHPGVLTVRHDYQTCGRLAAEYLLAKGFRRFGCVMVPGGCIPKRCQLFWRRCKNGNCGRACSICTTPSPSCASRFRRRNASGSWNGSAS